MGVAEQIGDRLRGVGADQPIVVPVADAHMLQAIEIAQKRSSIPAQCQLGATGLPGTSAWRARGKSKIRGPVSRRRRRRYPGPPRSQCSSNRTHRRKHATGPEVGKTRRLDQTSSPVTQNLRPERLATRAASFRYGGRHHPGIPGGIIPLYPGGFVGIRSPPEGRRKRHHSLGYVSRPQQCFSAGARTCLD